MGNLNFCVRSTLLHERLRRQEESTRGIREVETSPRRRTTGLTEEVRVRRIKAKKKPVPELEPRLHLAFQDREEILASYLEPTPYFLSLIHI